MVEDRGARVPANARRADLDAASGLMAAFLWDWWGYCEPADEALRASTALLLGDPATAFLQGRPARRATRRSCRLRLGRACDRGRPMVREDLYVDAGPPAARGLGPRAVEAPSTTPAARPPPTSSTPSKGNTTAIALTAAWPASTIIEPATTWTRVRSARRP